MKLSELSKLVDDAWDHYGDMPVILRIKTGDVDSEVNADKALVWHGPPHRKQAPQFYIETVDDETEQRML